MIPHPTDSTTIASTATGTVFTVIATIDTQDYIKTVVLAILGASVSFCFTLMLKFFVGRFKRSRGKRESN